MQKTLTKCGFTGLMGELEQAVDSDYILSRMLRLQAQSSCFDMDFLVHCALYVWMERADQVMAPADFLEWQAMRHGMEHDAESLAELRSTVAREIEDMVAEERENMLAPDVASGGCDGNNC